MLLLQTDMIIAATLENLPLNCYTAVFGGLKEIVMPIYRPELAAEGIFVKTVKTVG